MQKYTRIIFIMKQKHTSEQLLLNEIQVLLAEKRTYYALLRSSVALVTLPLTVIVFLVSTNEYHGLFNFVWLMVLVVGVLVLISIIGISFFARAENRIKSIDKMIVTIKTENKRIAEIIF